MRLGLSSYSFLPKLKSGEMSILDVIDWIAENGGEHIEIVPFGFNLVEHPELIQQIKDKAKTVNIDISNYAISANFIQDDEETYESEIRRVLKEVDIAQQLGVKFMRHDVAWRPIPEATMEQLERDLPHISNACMRIAQYAAQFGITTSVENHGYFLQHSDRVQRLIFSVNEENFKTTLDIGNFMCVDEDPVVSTQKNVPYASVVHLKDFYLRKDVETPGVGWFQTAGGNLLRAAILGHGDMNIRKIIRIIKQSGFNGYMSIEFEGMEDCLLGSKIGLENARRFWNEV